MDLIGTKALDADVGHNATVHVAAVGCLDLCTVDLYKWNEPLTKNTTFADLAVAGRIADYDGYADGVVTWTTVRSADTGEVEFIGSVPEFKPTGSVTPNTIYSLAVKDAGASKVYMVANFDNAPLPMGSALDSIIVTLRYRPASQSLAVFIS